MQGIKDKVVVITGGFGKALGHGFRVAPVLGGDINSDRLRKITNHYLATK